MLQPEVVRRKLGEHLPIYAIPSVLFPIIQGDFPLQPATGKTDMVALRKMAARRKQGNLLQQADIDQIKLTRRDTDEIMDVVRKITAFSLGLSENAVEMDSTFANQGGNSLSVVSAVALLTKVGLNVNAEMLLEEANTLQVLVHKLAKGVAANDVSTQPYWLELKDVSSLSPEQVEHTFSRLDYTFCKKDPLSLYYDSQVGVLTNLNRKLLEMYVASGPISFVAIDKRKKGLESIVGACLSTDASDSFNNWEDCKAFYHVISAVAEPAVPVILKKLNCNEILKVCEIANCGNLCLTNFNFPLECCRRSTIDLH